MAEIKYIIRNMTKIDVPKALDVWRETGMNEGTHSLYTWLEVDPEAFKIAVTDEGEVIGVCSAVIHNEDLACVGLYCVKEKYRGAGIGFKVWSACMEHITNRNACLYPVLKMLELYRSRGGFPIIESRWVYVIYLSISPVNTDKLSDTPPKGVDIKPFEESHLPLIYDYDEKLIGYNRRLALKLSCKETGCNTYVAVKDSECVGFGMIKMSCQGKSVIGPLYADEKDVAEVLLKKLILSLPQENGIYVMTLNNNDSANDLFKRIGFEKVREYNMLYRKKPLDTDLRKVYGIYSWNFSPH